MATRAKTARAAAKTAAKNRQVLSAANRFAATIDTTLTPADLKRRVKENRDELFKYGRKYDTPTGVVVYANKPLAYTVCRDKHDVGAVRRQDNECLLARALHDSVIGPEITDVYVGNATVKFKSALNPDIEVKFLLDGPSYGAVSTWDRTGRWPLKDGVHWLNAYPPSLRRGYVKPAGSKTRKVRAHKRSPTRHISLRTDINKAMLLAADTKAKAKKNLLKKKS